MVKTPKMSFEDWDYDGEPVWVYGLPFAIKNCPFQESDKLCPDCQSKLFLSDQAKVKASKAILNEINNFRKEEQESLHSEEDRLRELMGSRGQILENMRFIADDEDYSHLPWMSKQDFDDIVSLERFDLPFPFCMTDEEIVADAVMWCTDSSVSRTKSLWSYFYRDSEHSDWRTYGRGYEHDYYLKTEEILEDEFLKVTRTVQENPDYNFYDFMRNRSHSFSDYMARINSPTISVTYVKSSGSEWNEALQYHPPEVLVGYPFRPKNFDYEKGNFIGKSCEKIRKRLFYLIKGKIELRNKERVDFEKGILVNHSEKLASFAKEKKLSKISNKTTTEYIEDEGLELIWKDSKDVLRIRSNLILEGLR